MKSFILSFPKYVPSLIMILVALYFTFADNPLGVNGLKVFPYAEQVGHFILYFLVALTFILDYAKATLPGFDYQAESQVDYWGDTEFNDS
jgi:hypothetical protein